MINRSKLLDLLLDNQDLTDNELIEAIEKHIASSIKYDHTNEVTKVACGLPKFTKDMQSLSKKFENVSEQVQVTEELLSKRELAFMLVISFKRGAMLEAKSEKVDELMQLLMKGIHKK